MRASSLEWTVLKPGMIYGRGDHMLDHLSQQTFATDPDAAPPLADDRPSVAVLPFRQDWPDAQEAYFCDGIIEGIVYMAPPRLFGLRVGRTF